MAGERPTAVVSWSSGKDAAFALAAVRRRAEYDIVGLLSTVTAPYNRISMHGVRTALVQEQAERLGLPLITVEIPSPCPNVVYERAMDRACRRLVSEGVKAVVFGDLFLEDVREYRESRLGPTGLTPLFPLWGRPTGALAREMIASGLRARVVCLDPKRLPRSFAGRELSSEFLRDLPPSADPCGENGEFHTFVTDGPDFSRPIAVNAGETVEREGFVFADLIPVRSDSV